MIIILLLILTISFNKPIIYIEIKVEVKLGISLPIIKPLINIPSIE